MDLHRNGLAKIDSLDSWTVYNTSNSGLPENYIRAVFVDAENNLFVGTYLGGLAKYDGTTWTNFNPVNSPLPDYHVRAVTKDIYDTIWIGTTAGLITGLPTLLQTQTCIRII